MHPDINLKGFLSTVTDKQDITIDLLHLRKVWCADADHNPVFKDWQIYKCIYAEIDYNDRKYILSGGKWFNIDTDFVEKVNNQFRNIDKSFIKLPNYKDKNEGEYNKKVAESFPEEYALMDDKNRIFHGGGSGQVEFCDLFSKNKEIIHIKKYGQSSVFSHLFAQGFISGRLFQLDSDFRQKVVNKLPPSFQGLINVNNRPKESEYTILFGVISDSEGPDLHFPFFSRINLNNATRNLKGFGYKVELLKIFFDKKYSSTRIAPPSKV